MKKEITTQIIEKITMKNKITLLFAIFFMLVISLMSFTSAGDLDFRLNADLAGTYTTFYTETSSGSSVSYDGNDALVPGNPAELDSVLYSVVDGKNLLIDSWPNSAGSRTINLVYYIAAKSTGTLGLSWTTPTTYYTIYIKDYNDDSSYSALVRTIDTNTSSSYNLNQNNAFGYRYLQLVITYSPPSGSGSVVGGGGGTTPKVPLPSIKIDIPHPIAIESAGPIEFNITVENNGDLDLKRIVLNGNILMNSKPLNTPVVFDRVNLTSLNVGDKEIIKVKTSITSEEISVYEIIINATAGDPVYTTQGKVYVTFMGKNAAGIVKVIAFTEGLIEENAECYELTDMLNDAKKQLQQGNVKEALEEAQKALDSCKRIIEGNKKPLISTLQENKVIIYFGICVILALLIGIGYNLYRRWKFRGFGKYQTRRLSVSFLKS
jgi:hypothetical protein